MLESAPACRCSRPEKCAHLDGAYAAFGHVTEGMEIVDEICNTANPTDTNGTIPASEQPVIVSVTIRKP